MRSKNVHYIWVGDKPIPDVFISNLNNAVKLNPEYKFKLWKDIDIVNNAPDYAKKYFSSSTFHKLQIARYTIADSHGGIYSDFDIKWKQPFDSIFQLNTNSNLFFTTRKSFYFLKDRTKTPLVDDFFFLAHPGITRGFLNYCDNIRCNSKNDETEPYSVYALTEWLMTRLDVCFFTPEQISESEDSCFGVHSNKKTWKL